MVSSSFRSWLFSGFLVNSPIRASGGVFRPYFSSFQISRMARKQEKSKPVLNPGRRASGHGTPSRFALSKIKWRRPARIRDHVSLLRDPVPSLSEGGSELVLAQTPNLGAWLRMIQTHFRISQAPLSPVSTPWQLLRLVCGTTFKVIYYFQ